MVDEPTTLPEPARCLLRALWTWCYDPPRRLDDATADVAAKRLIPKYLIRALADAMVPDGLDPDKISGGWALLQDSKLVMGRRNDGRRDSERARYKMTGGRRYEALGREPLQCVQTRASAPWRPLAAPTGRWIWNGHTIDVRAVPNGDVGSRIVVSVADSKRFESAIDESNPELELVRLSESVLEVALGAGNASLTEARRGDEWAAGTMPLSPADTAELCERVIEHAEAWLRQDDRISSIVVLGGPEDHQEWALRREDEHRREQAQAGLILDGKRLVAALVSHDLDPVPLLTLLNHTRPDDSIGGANASESEWPEVKIALQHAAIRLRLQDVKQAARDPTAQSDAPCAPPAEQAVKPDGMGYVAAPADTSAYVTAMEIVCKHVPVDMPLTVKQLTAIIRDYATAKIRWTRPTGKDGEPRPNRRNVHLTDWLAYVERRQADGFGAEDEAWPVVSEDETAERTDAIRRQKSAGK